MEDTKPGIKILIVDDDKFILDMYTLKFKERKFDVTQALGSVDALNKLKSGIEPEIILLDIVMPTTDGFELLGIIRNEKLVPKAKVIVLSNLGQPSDVEKARALHANGYMVKASLTPSEVVEKVEKVLHGEDSFTHID